MPRSGNVREIPHPTTGEPRPDDPTRRVETGAVQFGDDWPGLFVRGDEAFGLALDIEAVERFVSALPATARAEVGGALARLKELAEMIRRDVVLTP